MALPLSGLTMRRLMDCDFCCFLVGIMEGYELVRQKSIEAKKAPSRFTTKLGSKDVYASNKKLDKNSINMPKTVTKR